MATTIFTRTLVNQVLNDLVYPARYIRHATFFYSQEYSKNIRKEKYNSVFIDALFEPKFHLIDCIQQMDEEIESRISINSKNPIALHLITSNLKDDYNKNKTKFLRENILKEVEQYNREEIDYVRNSEVDDPIFLVDISTFDKYFESITNDFKTYEAVILKYISSNENSNTTISPLHRTIGELFENYRIKIHKEKNTYLPFQSYHLKNKTSNNIKSLTEVMNDLIDKGFLNKDESNISSFKSLFTGEEVKNRINWIGTLAELKCFIVALRTKLDNPRKGIWQVTANCFTIRGTSYDGRQIGRSDIHEIRPESRIQGLKNITAVIMD